MSTLELQKTRSDLILWIEQLSDSNILSVLNEIKNTKSNDDWYNLLTEAQKSHINEGIEDIENGRVVSSEEFWHNLKNG